MFCSLNRSLHQRQKTILCFQAVSRCVTGSHSSRSISTDGLSQERISGIWYVPTAAKTDYTTIIKKLPQLLPSKREHLKTAIIFVTPSIAHWLTPGHEFLTQAINRIYQPVLSQSAPTSIVAVVDALPGPSLLKGRKASRHDVVRGAEGLALCLIPQAEPLDPDLQTESELPVIRFFSRPGENENDKQHIASATLQIANTLFVNGSKSTLFRNQWTTTSSARGLQWQITEPAEILPSLTIPIDRDPKHFLTFDNHLHAITSPRQVVSSMGNVVRELQNDDGSAIKASTELETLVPEFLKRNEAEYGPGRVEVYALLMPPEEARGVHGHSISDDSAVSQSSTTKQDLKTPKFARTLLHQALWQGGRLHKVTGGGGGWGKKAGLLSLDTSTNFEASSKFEIAMFPSFDDEVDSTRQSSSTEEAIPAGWSMQFLATFVGPEQDPYRSYHSQHHEDLSTWTAKRWSWGSRKNDFVVGITDSKDEHVLTNSINSTADDKIIAIPAAFGMLSANGICLSLEFVEPDESASAATTNSRRVAHQFRVDAPQTTFRTTWKSQVDPKDYSELDEVPAFQSNIANQTEALGSMVHGALKQSRKLPFRKISFQPRPKFEIPVRGHRKTRIETAQQVQPTDHDQQTVRIRKYQSRDDRYVVRNVFTPMVSQSSS